MSAHGHATGGSDYRLGARAAFWIVVASVLVGAGVTGLAYWLITFEWVLLASALLLLAGGLLFFSPLTGPDHA